MSEGMEYINIHLYSAAVAYSEGGLCFHPRRTARTSEVKRKKDQCLTNTEDRKRGKGL